MSGAVRVEGLETVLSNLNKEIKKLKTGSKKGLIRAGFLIQRGSQQRCPVDTSNLKNSHYTVWGEGAASSPNFRDVGRTGRKVSSEAMAQLRQDHEDTVASMQDKTSGRLQVAVGASAAYALFVHEDEQAEHVHGGQAKFLQASVEENLKRIIDVVAERAKESIAR
jgi:hypothetical protein